MDGTRYARTGVLVLYLYFFRFLLADSFSLLWKNGIHDCAAIGIMLFLAVGYFVGYYQTYEIMMGLFAKTLHDDEVIEASVGYQKLSPFYLRARKLTDVRR